MADSITKLFPAGEDETSKTFFMNLSAEDFGVPEDGYMVLSLDSDGFAGRTGSHWDDTQYVSGDGMINFTEIPMMRVGSNVTVVVLCYAADGTLISSGYSSGEAKENGVPMEISILGSARIALGPNASDSGNTVDHDGKVYSIFGYSGTSLEMAAVNTSAGSTMEVKINGTVISTTADQSFTTILADGYNAIEVTVTKGDNTPIVVQRNYYVAKEFTSPGITLSSNGVANGLTVTSGGKSYEVLEYTGTNMVMTVTNSYTGTATFGVTVNDSPLSVSTSSVTATLADGPNAIVATLTENALGSVTAEGYVYVVKKLVKPVIEQFGGTLSGGTVTSGGRSYQILEYTSGVPTVTASNSYADAANASFTVTLNGNPVSGSATSASALLADGCNTIVAALSRDHCVTQTETKYFYVTKPLVAPVITRGGSGATNGKTATGTDGMTYTVIEYDGAGATRPNITATNSYDGTGATFTVKINGNTKSGTPASVSSDLADGFNKVVATLSNAATGVSVNDTKYFYVIKKLTKPTVSYTDGILTDEDKTSFGGYHPLRYSYLASTIVMPKFSVTNPYSDGTVSMSVSVDGGTPLVGAATTGNITNQPLTDGTHTITITLSHPYCTNLVVNKKIKVAIKAVKVSVSKIDWWFCSEGSVGQLCVNQEFYVQAKNDGTEETAKPCYTVSGQYGNNEGGNNSTLNGLTPDSANNYVYLTDPASTFYFHTNRSSCTNWGHEVSKIEKGVTPDMTHTLAELKSLDPKKLNTGDVNYNGDTSSVNAHGNYTIYFDLADKAYTEGTDDE